MITDNQDMPPLVPDVLHTVSIKTGVDQPNPTQKRWTRSRVMSKKRWSRSWLPR